MLSNSHFYLVQGLLGGRGCRCLKGTRLFLPWRQCPCVEWASFDNFWWFSRRTASISQHWAHSAVRRKVGLAKFLLNKKDLVEFTCDTSSMQIQKHNFLFQSWLNSCKEKIVLSCSAVFFRLLWILQIFSTYQNGWQASYVCIAQRGPLRNHLCNPGIPKRWGR